MSGDPLLGLKCDGDKRLKVIETERGLIAPRPGLILEWAGEGRREDRTLLADVLPNRGFEVATPEPGRRVVVCS
jgi:hypothetical protein